MPRTSTDRTSPVFFSQLSLRTDEERERAAEVIAAARALRPLLRADQDDADRRGTYSPEIQDAMLAAGLFDITTPARFGGMQLPLPVLTAVIIEIATGNPGSGWCFALAAQHTTTIAAHWPLAVQEEVLSAGPFLAPHQFARPGDVRAVEGGYVVDGDYPFCSGSPYSTHLMITAAVRGSGEQITLVVPRSAYEVLDDWDRALGMKASGSNSVRFDKVFVDHAHVIPGIGEDDLSELPLGVALHDDALYLGRLSAYHPSGLAALAVGTARAAVEEFEGMIRASASRTITGVPKSEDPLFQLTLGRATADADAAEALVYAGIDAYTAAARRHVETGVPVTAAEIARIAGVATSAIALAHRAVDTVFEHIGTLRVADGTPMQRYFRDISMLRTHGRFHPAGVAVARGETVLTAG
jgi:3-hydroxy-9,10-secoandrosta-1,3,5(10)-triene-9,17-dione monooxygenase